jgi:hypothetical protein
MFCTLLNGQVVQPSNTYIRTCMSDIECSSINSSSFLFFDEAKSKFYIKIDFNAAKTGNDSVDFWLEDLNDTYFYFKATLRPEDFPDLSSYNASNIKLSGQAFLNNIWRDQTIDMSIFRAQEDLLNNNINGRDIDAYRVNFSFSFSPKDFNVHKKPQRLTNTIFIGVGSGKINLLRAGMEGQVREAYNH